VEFRPALAQRILKALLRARSESIQGQGKPRCSDTPHHSLLYCSHHAMLLNQCLQREHERGIEDGLQNNREGNLCGAAIF
jgi:hypothetical protein